MSFITSWSEGSYQDINSGSSQTVDFNELGFGTARLDLSGTGGAVTLTLSNPLEGGLYILGFHDVGVGVNVTFPSTVKNIAGTALGLVNLLLDSTMIMVFNGTDYIVVKSL